MLWEGLLAGDEARVSTLLSTQGAQSFINYQGADGVTPLFLAAAYGQLIAACCNVNLQMKNGGTPLVVKSVMMKLLLILNPNEFNTVTSVQLPQIYVLFLAL